VYWLSMEFLLVCSEGVQAHWVRVTPPWESPLPGSYRGNTGHRQFSHMPWGWRRWFFRKNWRASDRYGATQ